ncbi:AraC family transcriptional regulator [Citricoccus sp. NPDC079358]|uniref:AraC family transcriptional regulator n=1 Tax=Citricoccus sp. NPDC079358 TaxID=3154653 RepID=UPI00344F0AB2
MDTLSEVLENIRSSGALIGQNLLSPPWAIRQKGGASITVLVMLRGEAWLRRDGADPLRLGTRDLAILTGSGSTLLSSDPTGRIPTTCVLTAEGACLEETGERLTAGNGGLVRVADEPGLDSEHVLLAGSFPTSGRIAGRLLEALPNVVVVPRAHQRSRALGLLESELENREPGQQAVLDRLLDLVLIGALRDWFALPDTDVPAWYGAAGDPVVGPALGALHADPARAWTVESLARRAQVSRATFARRFAEVMGEPPISYLTGWRLCVAADLLQEREDTTESIARQVGYSSAFALSAAFTREYGVRPSRYRVQSRRLAVTEAVE